MGSKPLYQIFCKQLHPALQRPYQEPCTLTLILKQFALKFQQIQEASFRFLDNRPKCVQAFQPWKISEACKDHVRVILSLPRL